MKGKLLNNRYRILETISQEDFSASFLAIDTHLPSKPRCIIKKLQAILGNSQMKAVKQRFEREAAIIESLGSENAQIPQLYAYFSEGGDFYLVQEWIEGITLQQKQQVAEKVSEFEVRSILLDLLPLLDYVHSRRIVHRNIKPDNIILRTEDNLPVLVGFSVVKEIIANANQNQTAQCSMVLGTPEYMPAEQAIGRPIFSSDLYSLGLTAIFLLTGKSPSTFQYDSQKERILWHTDAPRLETNLASVINRAIRSHPKDRYATASEMLSALQSTVVCLNPVDLSIFKVGGWTDVSPPTTEGDPQPAGALQLVKIPPDKHTFTFNKNKILLKALVVGIGMGLVLFGIWQKLFKPMPPLESAEESAYFEQPKSFKSRTVAQITSNDLKGLNSVPIFMLGTPQAEILQALGEPTKRRKGYWSNSTAWLYENIVPDKIDLGYLVDNNSKKLRQTEVSFAASIERKIIQDILNNLLLDKDRDTVDLALEKVYSRQSERQEFKVGNLQGIIQRNQKDRIYTAVWDEDFH